MVNMYIDLKSCSFYFLDSELAVLLPPEPPGPPPPATPRRARMRTLKPAICTDDKLPRMNNSPKA